MLQVHQPLDHSARLYRVLVGDAAGIVAGVAGVLIAQAGNEPSVLAANLLTWPRVWASVIGMVVAEPKIGERGRSDEPARGCSGGTSRDD